MTLYDAPKPAMPPVSGKGQKIKMKLQPVADALVASPGVWFAVGEGKSHNGIGTLKQRLGVLVPGIELVGRQDKDRGVVVLYARAPEASP